MKLLLQATPLALWYETIHEAQKASAIFLEEEVESYLVFLMMRYTARPDVIQQIIASTFLKGLEMRFKQRETHLQEVGDVCLLLSGLFPAVAQKRLVNISYFVNIGQSAYGSISQSTNDLYSLLAHQFVSLMDVLQSMRCYSEKHPDLLPLEAYELWSETGSKRAFSLIKEYTNFVPLERSVLKN